MEERSSDIVVHNHRRGHYEIVRRNANRKPAIATNVQPKKGNQPTKSQGKNKIKPRRVEAH
ncbi:short-chain dehydrogenase [Anopheles sinensis]|uniref:Short-chain dehydrogenase n=1 Tax=Anopheles sinensis TaxID=74873 RepID=A0A084VBP4_ANOSI|nr:short-chain dehydrogenase [Anopheles sinensis]